MKDVEEKALLLDRKYVCPVCQAKFKAKSVKTGAAKLIDTAMDLRPMYQNIDIVKYDIVLCPECGYAALTKYFQVLSQAQILYIRNKVSKNFKKRKKFYDYYDYDTAEERYKLALLSTIVKVGAPSELGFVCLKLSWIFQARLQGLKEGVADFEKCQTEAKIYSEKALEYLMKARMEEDYPICGMDMPTLDYLLAALSAMNNQLDMAMKMLGTVAQTRDVSERLKNKAYDLKEFINQKQKQANKENEGE